jgi:hypothetical protein
VFRGKKLLFRGKNKTVVYNPPEFDEKKRNPYNNDGDKQYLQDPSAHGEGSSFGDSGDERGQSVSLNTEPGMVRRIRNIRTNRFL